MKAARTVLLMAAVILMAGAIPAHAQNPMTWAGSLYAGYAKMSETGAPNGSFGVRGNMFAMVDPVIGLGAEVGYHKLGKTDATGTDGVNVYTGEAGFSAWQATANVMARGNSGKIRPYGIGGLGLYALHASFDATDGSGFTASDTKSKFGFNIGGGVMFRPSTSNLGFGVEGRWHQVMKAMPDDTGTPDKSAMDMFTITGGVTFN